MVSGVKRAFGAAVILLAIIGLAAGLHRILLIAGGINANARDPLESVFAQPPWITLLHAAPGVLFMVLGPLQFVRWIRSRYLAWHRWSGRVFVVSAVFVGFTGLCMGFLKPIGGIIEGAATATFVPLFLFELTKAVVHIRRREIAQHREWMIRTFSLGLAISTMRPMVAGFFFFSQLSIREFFGIVLWTGFTIHAIAAEVWVHWTRTSPRAPLSVTTPRVETVNYLP